MAIESTGMNQPNQSIRLPLRSFSVLLMAALVACFMVEEIVVVRMEKPYDTYLALSGYGMKSGHLWELVTYQFMHMCT